MAAQASDSLARLLVPGYGAAASASSAGGVEKRKHFSPEEQGVFAYDKSFPTMTDITWSETHKAY